MRGSRTRAFVPALVVLALVGVVAVAATGRNSAGTTETRAPAAWVLDTFLSIFLVLLIPAAALFAYGLLQRKEIQGHAAAMGLRRRNLLTYMVLMGLFAGITYYRLHDWERVPFEDGISDAFSDGSTTVEPPGSATSPEPAYEPRFMWPVLAVFAVLVVMGVVTLLIMRRRDQLSPEARLARELAAALDDSLDELRDEPDPRKAVIAAYARLERVLAAHRLGRVPSETPNEYLSRILEQLDVERSSVRRLTDLFTEAKFSRHDVDPSMKEEAILALSTVRDELRARRDAERQAKLSELEARLAGGAS
jgi:hypothetical protein